MELQSGFLKFSEHLEGLWTYTEEGWLYAYDTLAIDDKDNKYYSLICFDHMLDKWVLQSKSEIKMRQFLYKMFPTGS